MKKILFILSICFFISCCENEDEITYLDISDVEFIDLGKIPFESSFIAIPNRNGFQECTIRTIGIKKNDNLRSAKAYIKTKSNKLYIDIDSSPHDFDCISDSCFTVHDIKFNLYGQRSKEYTIIIGINNIYGKGFKYFFENFPK